MSFIHSTYLHLLNALYVPGPGLDVWELIVQEGTTHGDVTDSTNQEASYTTLEGRDLKSQGTSYPSAALVVMVAENR